MASLLVHIGYQKTGSSWLQQRLFSVRGAGFGLVVRQSKVKKTMVAPDDFEFDAARCQKAYQPRTDMMERRGVVPVISAERLSGRMAGPDDGARMAERLARVVPEARVLVVLREQRSMLLSTYAHYVKSGGMLELRRFLNRPAAWRDWPCDLRRYKYERLIAHYHGVFGPERILALTYEQFRDDPEAFVRDLISFSGAEPEPGALERLQVSERINESWSPAALAVKRRANWLVREYWNPWAALDARGTMGSAINDAVRAFGTRMPRSTNDRISREMLSTIAESVGDYYRESNARTAELTGIELSQYGYDVEPAPRAVGVPTTTSAES
jgi:Sulfotransferase family